MRIIYALLSFSLTSRLSIPVLPSAKGHMSAVMRLAASKPKYVKSQQVVNSHQEAAISIGSASVSSTGSSNRSSTQLSLPVQLLRSSTKKRRDSLLLYRQKCDLLRGSGVSEQRRHITRQLPLSSANRPVRFSDKSAAGGLAVPEIERRSGKGVSRSHSDISSRYSKNFADFDAFFKFCGLDGEVIDSLGRENFSARSDDIVINIRSVSLSTSDDGFSRDSGDNDGLLEDELHDKIRQGTSVIERNARIIKWLYSCKNASETGKTLRDLN
uniref:Family with sequence similarity 110 member C n=1 Tax=Fundulus heteroclitus TaxID=8078 RepID=A0A3Q2NN48_FUNHE